MSKSSSNVVSGIRGPQNLRRERERLEREQRELEREQLEHREQLKQLKQRKLELESKQESKTSDRFEKEHQKRQKEYYANMCETHSPSTKQCKTLVPKRPSKSPTQSQKSRARLREPMYTTKRSKGGKRKTKRRIKKQKK